MFWSCTKINVSESFSIFVISIGNLLLYFFENVLCRGEKFYLPLFRKEPLNFAALADYEIEKEKQTIKIIDFDQFSDLCYFIKEKAEFDQ